MKLLDAACLRDVNRLSVNVASGWEARSKQRWIPTWNVLSFILAMLLLYLSFHQNQACDALFFASLTRKMRVETEVGNGP